MTTSDCRKKSRVSGREAKEAAKKNTHVSFHSKRKDSLTDSRLDRRPSKPPGVDISEKSRRVGARGGVLQLQDVGTVRSSRGVVVSREHLGHQTKDLAGEMKKAHTDHREKQRCQE